MRDPMRAWCEATFTDMPDDATDDEIRATVDYAYPGGVLAFRLAEFGALVAGPVAS